MGVFSGIEKAEVYSSGRYITPGRYRMVVNQILLVDSKQKRGVQFFVVEATILHTTSPDYEAGDNVSWLVDMSKQVAHSNCKNFAMALNPDAKDGDITEEVMDALVGPDNPGQGITVDCDASTRTSRAGNDYTRVDWKAATKEWVGGSSAKASDDGVPF